MSGVTLRRLGVFIAVVETGGFANAAHRLGISQPSVSAHIKALEEDVHGALFERRHGHRVTLTPRGVSFHTHAERMLAEANEMHGGTGKRGRRPQSRLVFACQNSIASFFLASRLAPFAASCEEHEFVVRTGARKEVVSQVRTGAADVGYVLGNTEPRGLASTVVGRQRLIFVASPSHPLARRKHLAIADLERQNFVGRSPESSFGRELDAVLMSIGLEPRKIVAQAVKCSVMTEMVVAGAGIACFPAGGVSRSLEAGTLVVLNVDAPALQMDIRQVLSLSARRSPRIETFMEFSRLHESGES